jgi:hypothetical protein
MPEPVKHDCRDVVFWAATNAEDKRSSERIRRLLKKCGEAIADGSLKE